MNIKVFWDMISCVLFLVHTMQHLPVTELLSVFLAIFSWNAIKGGEGPLFITFELILSSFESFPVLGTDPSSKICSNSVAAVDCWVSFSVTLFVLNALNCEKSNKLLVALFCFLKEREKKLWQIVLKIRERVLKS